MKARHLKVVLAAVRLLPAGERDGVLAHISPGTLSAIEESIGVEWLPIALDLELTRAVHGALGTRGADVFWRRAQVTALGSPLYKTFVDGARSLFGSTSRSSARWIPAGWDLVFRDCGRWLVLQEQPGGVLMRGEGIPASCLRDATWVAAVASCFSVLLGHAELVRVRSATGVIEIGVATRRAARPSTRAR